jgi:hypothetical protein
VRAQAERMLHDPRATRMLAQFQRNWLGLRERQEDGDSSPFSPSLRATVLRAADAQLAHLVLEEDADLERLLTVSEVMADGEMAAFYGLGAPGAGALVMRASAAPARRQGLLTMPALLATYAHGPDSAPVLRGRVVCERILCRPLPPPPNGLAPAGPPPDPTLTTRQRYEQITRSGSCAVCHEQFEPLGFGLENFDGYGRWRSSENGQPIDARGIVHGTGFDGPEELARYLSASEGARDCMVTTWFRYAFRREDTGIDDCTLGGLREAFAAGGKRLRALLFGIIESDAFVTVHPGH